MRKMLNHITAGRVEVDEQGPGNVKLWIVDSHVLRADIGVYESVGDAIAALDEVISSVTFKMLRPILGHGWFWMITSAAPGEVDVPVFASDASGSPVLGYARCRAEAQTVAMSSTIAYRADGFGPDGREGWVKL